MVHVAAVIVTRNRQRLLLECLAAIKAQTHSTMAIYLVDNASDDGTQAGLAAAGWMADPDFHLLRTSLNVGGAGGFKLGMATAYMDGHEWLWLMDDDCLPSTTALAALLEAQATFEGERSPRVLCSRVVWTNGRLHPMNVVAVATADKEFLYDAVAQRCLGIRSGTFVSMLAHRSTIETEGLPIASYFLWMDDIEWSARVLRRYRGVLVPMSVVTHRTERCAGTLDAIPGRFHFHVRNSLWMLLYGRCFALREKFNRLGTLIIVVLLWMLRHLLSPGAYVAVGWGLIRGLIPPHEVRHPSPAPTRTPPIP